MRRMITYVAVWFVAGAAAVTLASVAVSTVGNQVTGSRPSPLSADEVRAELAGDDETTTTLALDSTSSTLPEGTSTTTSDGAAPPTTSPPSGSTGGDPDGAPATTVAPPTPQGEIRTYNLIGGTVTLRFSASGVTVEEATPKAGYSVEVEADESNGWQITFDSDAHRSRVEGWWDGGPQDDVEEQDKSNN